jgi:hypothetical protein
MSMEVPGTEKYLNEFGFRATKNNVHHTDDQAG